MGTRIKRKSQDIRTLIRQAETEAGGKRPKHYVDDYRFSNGRVFKHRDLPGPRQV
jgi:hypothetical protein